MMSLRHLKETITWWENTGSNGFGGYTFGSPVLIKGRWEERQEKFIDSNGEEVLSRAVVYLDRSVSIGDFLLLGESEETSPIDHMDSSPRAWQVRQFRRVSNLRNVTSEYRAFL